LVKYSGRKNVSEYDLTIFKGIISQVMQRISQRLTGRIKELAKRYDATLPALEDDVEKMEKKVRGHLGKMGFKV
jgi:type I restriction enzyme M protein